MAMSRSAPGSSCSATATTPSWPDLIRPSMRRLPAQGDPAGGLAMGRGADRDGRPEMYAWRGGEAYPWTTRVSRAPVKQSV